MRERLEADFGSKRTVRGNAHRHLSFPRPRLLKEWNKDVTVADEQEALAILSEMLTACNCVSATTPRVTQCRQYRKRKCGAAGYPAAVAYDAYCARMRSLGLIDFDDILTMLTGKLPHGRCKV